MRYEGNVFRPPSEARSYILQCTVGCSHNQCSFCSMYKDKRFHKRPLDDILEDIRMARDYYGPGIQKVFLADGDALIMEQEELLTIIPTLYKTFPYLNHLGVYSSPWSILGKTDEQLKELKEAGITIAYLGVETGDPELLKAIHKGVTVDQMVEAGQKIRRAGIQLSCTVILGLAGRTPQATRHAIETGKILTRIQPDYVGALTIMIEPRTEIYKKYKNGEFEPPKPFEVLDELRLIIANMDMENCEFRSNHASNYLAVKGHLPDDKEVLVKNIERIIRENDSTYLRPEYFRAL